MAEKWMKVTADEAQAHPLYGVKGWLLLFEVANTIGAILAGAVLVMTVVRGGVSLLALLWLNVLVSSALIVFLCTTKARSFRKTVTWFIVGQTLLWMLVAAVAFPGPAIDGWLGVVIGAAGWVAYLQRSKRVRLTFEHTIRASEATTRGAVTDAPLDEMLWARALQELDGASRRPGIWARALAEANGDETQAKAIYLRVRARELDQESRDAEMKRRAEGMQPKGTCPNTACWSVIPLNVPECPNCGESFAGGSRPHPLRNN